MNKRLNALCFFCIAFACLSPGICAQHPGSELIEYVVAENKCVGIAAGYTVAGDTTWLDAAGFSDLEAKIPFDSLTITRIASIAKPMTAIAIMQLFEQGQLELDKPIQTYIPDFPVKKEGAITVRNLLQHSAGIDDYKNNKEQENKIRYESLSDVVSLFKDRNLVATPGQAFNYSTYGYVLLGLIIEKVSGMTYEAYMRKNIWEAAGMAHTGIDRYDHPSALQSKIYHRNSKGEIEEAEPTNLSDRIPGGGIVSTVTDMLRFGEAILNNTLISASTFNLMVEDPRLKTEGNGYGLGWYLYGENPAYGYVYGHNGTQTGASTFMMLLPAQRTAIIVLSNTSGAIKEISNITVQLFDVAYASHH